MLPNARLLIAVFVVALPSCATILSGGMDVVAVDSTVKGARILIDDELRGTTNVLASLDRGHGGHRLRVEHEDYLPAERVITERFDPRVLLGIFVDLGIVTIPIDVLSGNAMAPRSIQYTIKVADGRLVIVSATEQLARQQAEMKKRNEAKPAGNRGFGSDPSGGVLRRS